MSFLKNITKLITVATLGFLIVSGIPALAQRDTDINETKVQNPIPLDDKQTYTLYFQYGSEQTDLDLRNSVASIKLDGAGVEILPDGFADIYNGNPNRLDSEVPPAAVTTTSCRSGSVPNYKISSGLWNASTKELKYGLQTAYGTNNGLANGTLRKKSTGCIQVKVKVAANAKVNDIANITFDWDSANSPDFQVAARPRIDIVRMKIGEAKTATPPPTTPTCTTTQELINNVCVAKCSPNQTRNASGVCIDTAVTPPTTTACTATQESVNGNCVPKCSTNQTRNASGTCVQNTLPPTGGLQISLFLSALALALISFIVLKTRRTIKKVDMVN